MTLDSNSEQMINNEEASHDPAEIAALALQHMADDGELLSRFLALSGLDPANMRQASQQPGFLVGVLDFYLNFEPSLLEFARAKNIDPQAVAAARTMLDQGGSNID